MITLINTIESSFYKYLNNDTIHKSVFDPVVLRIKKQEHYAISFISLKICFVVLNANFPENDNL